MLEVLMVYDSDVYEICILWKFLMYRGLAL